MRHPPAGLAAVDPTNPQSWNRYSYVGNNPLSSIDPSGLGGICLAFLYDGGCGSGPGGGVSTACALYVWMWDSWDNWTGHYEGMLCGGGGGGGGGSVGGGSHGGAKGGSASGGGNSSGGFLSGPKKVVSAVCSAIPDVSTLGLGFDVGIPFGSPGFSGGIAANGASGELSLTGTMSINVGLILPDAYASIGAVFKAPTNASLNSSIQKPDAPQVTIGIERVGASFTPNSAQLTFGPSFSPYTVAVGGSVTKTTATIPYLGYLLQPSRAVCKAITGK
jgi:hypothetical protein